MFSNDRKTIGVFIERTISEFQNKLCRGIITEAEKRGYNVAVFTPYGNYGRNVRYFDGELKIYNLPEYEKFDGVIMALDTMDEPDSRRIILNNIRTRCHCPVVSIREVVDGANNLLVDNTRCMESIIEHFIVAHQFTNLCFMTGPTDHWDAVERMMCFKDVMSKHNLPVGNHQMFFGDFWQHKGKEACDWFLQDGARPQAIICANDHMAVAVTSELIRRGIRVPEEISVSGYDGLSSTLAFTPSVTTVMVPFFEMGQRAVEIIDQKQDCPARVEDYYFETKLILRESCGCLTHSDRAIIETRRNQYEAVIVNDNREKQFNFMSIRLGETYDIETMGEEITKNYIFNIDGFSDYCFCVKEDLENCQNFDDYSDKMEMRFYVKNRERCEKPFVLFDRKELLPKEITDESPQIWYFSPIHFQNRTFGYEAFQFQTPEVTGQIYLYWNIIMGNKVQDILIHQKMQGLIRELENMYDRDALTGMYNRRGFEDRGGKVFESAKREKKPVFLAIIDLDGMKQINDNYGHIEGDEALRKVCEVIGISCCGTNVNARTGGDEFVVVASGITEEEGCQWMDSIEKNLERYNQTGEKKYDIHASYGYIWKTPGVADTMESYITSSDEMMYENKAANKARRHEPMR